MSLLRLFFIGKEEHMTTEEKVSIEHRLTEVESRTASNTKRLNEHDEAIKDNSGLIGAIKELAVETKYMREDLNETISRLDKLENKDGDKWEKFKWLIVAGLVSIALSYLAVTIGVK
jgi:chromosome segregation ATPase